MNLLGRLIWFLLALFTGASDNSTYYNPVLPGWHSDPSCAQVDGTFYCVTSTFISFPGLPIYASKDLINWKLASHVWNRESQLPGVSWNTTGQMLGMYAATLRYHEGEFFCICVYLGPLGILGTVFKTTQPSNEESWSDPVTFQPPGIDPDLFWDVDGKLWVALAGCTLQELDLETAQLGQSYRIWNGTGGASPEGPHVYKKDDWYYLLIAEGGTETGHAVTIARARNITGPYEAFEDNPILTNRNTTEYFQTVGHADLFQDAEGNWWGMSLATRSGPAWEIYPMGRETVLFPVTWDEGEWPVLQPVRGKMSGWTIPEKTLNLPGDGPFNTDPDVYDFEEGSTIPRNLVYWRVPQDDAFMTTSHGIRIVPNRANLTGDAVGDNITSGRHGISFIGRRQTDTLFEFSVDLSFNPNVTGQEAGVTVFLTQFNHIDLGLVLVESKANDFISSRGISQLALRYRAEGADVASVKIVPVPQSWGSGSIRLQIDTVNDTHYDLKAMPVDNPHSVISIALASAKIVSGGTGPFTGSLVGAYATCNGAGSGVECPEGGIAYVSRWRYTGIAQYIAANESVPSW